MPARHSTKKAAYRIRNWRQYNRALVHRGSLTVWVDQKALDAWNYHGPAQWGARFVYSDVAIQCLLTLRAVFRLPLRGTQGMAHSVFELMGLDLEVPHYSTLSRRAAELSVDLARKSEGPLHLVLDSTGLKVYGEGEWKVRRHGYSKRRTWRKLHLAVNDRAKLTHTDHPKQTHPGPDAWIMPPACGGSGDHPDPGTFPGAADPGSHAGAGRHDRSGSPHRHPRPGPPGPLRPRHRPAHRALPQHRPQGPPRRARPEAHGHA